MNPMTCHEKYFNAWFSGTAKWTNIKPKLERYPSKNQQKMVKFSYLIGCSPSQNQLLNTSLPTMNAFFPNFLFPLPHLPSPGQEEQCTEMGPSMETWQSTNNRWYATFISILWITFYIENISTEFYMFSIIKYNIKPNVETLQEYT